MSRFYSICGFLLQSNTKKNLKINLVLEKSKQLEDFVSNYYELNPKPRRV